MHTSPVARKESAGRIPGRSTARRQHASSSTHTSPEYGHEKPWPSSGLHALTLRMPVTQEPHRSSGAPCAKVTPIDAVRCAHQHPHELRAENEPLLLACLFGQPRPTASLYGGRIKFHNFAGAYIRQPHIDIGTQLCELAAFATPLFTTTFHDRGYSFDIPSSVSIDLNSSYSRSNTRFASGAAA